MIQMLQIVPAYARKLNPGAGTLIYELKFTRLFKRSIIVHNNIILINGFGTYKISKKAHSSTASVPETHLHFFLKGDP